MLHQIFYSNKLFFPTFKTEFDQLSHNIFLVYSVEYLYKGWKSYTLLLTIV